MELKEILGDCTKIVNLLIVEGVTHNFSHNYAKKWKMYSIKEYSSKIALEVKCTDLILEAT